MLHLCCTCVLQCGFCVTPVQLRVGRPSRPGGSREIAIDQRSLMLPPAHPRAARHKMEAVANPAGPGPEARDQQQMPRKSESLRRPGSSLDPRGRALVRLLALVPTPAAAPGVRCPTSPATVRQARKLEDPLPRPLRGCRLLATSRPHLYLRIAVKWSEHRHWLRQPAAAPGIRCPESRQPRQIRGDLSPE
ncbi:hypothetical protein NDU88_004102 [Pleurodeles waltl]|uniref:Uncharacterized protein n=1 Tax=Pleurodeles waltl TaxID=8319 RepID=A0AAV7TRM5_PLEWA|nr:hypothetical protein NDU88_004102 [Pleurodeles waltl]